MDDGLKELFGEPVYSYTRAHAIADGYLIDVSIEGKAYGFKLPVAVTRAVWADCIEWAEEDTKRQTYQDESGRLQDVVCMAAMSARLKPVGDTVLYRVLRVPRGGRARVPTVAILKMVISGGDDGQPVITIMQPNED